MTIFSVMTYNIHKGFTVGNLRFSLHDMKTAIHKKNPDIVLLQEVQGKHQFFEKTISGFPNQDQAQFIADTHYPYHAYHKNAHYVAGNHGNAILSKFPIIQAENIDVSKSKSASRSVLHAVLQLPGNKTLDVICVHFGLFKTERANQLDILSQRIIEHISPAAPIILGGDFNDWLQKASDHLETLVQLQEIFKTRQGSYARSFPVYRPLLTVDRLYYRQVTPIENECLINPPWNKLSDHAPLYAKFELL